MEHSQIEHDALRNKVSDLGVGVGAAARSEPEPKLTLEVLRSIDEMVLQCAKTADFYQAWTNRGVAVLELVRACNGADKVDPDKEVYGLYGRCIVELRSMVEKFEGYARRFAQNQRLEGSPHRNDIVEGFKACSDRVNGLAELMTEIREAIVEHDSAVTEIELSQEQLEHVQRCMENPKAPGPKYAAGIEKLRTMLDRGDSLFH